MECPGMVSGNCKSGEGEFLIAFPANDTKLETKAINPVMDLTLYKGKFSNDGKNFEGTAYTPKVYYDVLYKKEKPRLEPKIKENSGDLSFWKPGEVATGTMEHEKIGYWQLSTPFLAGEEIKIYKKTGTNYGLCFKCMEVVQ